MTKLILPSGGPAAHALSSHIRALVAMASTIGPLGCGARDEPPDGAATAQQYFAEPVAVSTECRRTRRPRSATTARDYPLVLYTWDDPSCDTLYIEIQNVGDEPWIVWDEPIRWAALHDEIQLRAAPAPEKGAGNTRSPKHNNRTCCSERSPDGRWAELAADETRRWTASLTHVETNDTEQLCIGHTPTWYDAPLAFDSIEVSIWAARMADVDLPGPLLSTSRPFEKQGVSTTITVSLALDTSLEVHAYVPEWSHPVSRARLDLEERALRPIPSAER